MKKALPNPDFGCSGLFALPYEAVKWELVKTAIRLDLFDHLQESETAEEIARKLATHPMNTGHFLNALTALGYLSKKEGRFRNTSLAQTFLTDGSDTSIGPSLLFMESWILPLLGGGMEALLRDGPTPSPEISDEGIWATGARSSMNHGRRGRAQRIAGYVASLPEFPSFSRMLDLGAGPGIIGIAVTAAHPSLRCVLFDQPAVCRVAEQVIAEYGVEDRMETMSGDYTKDPIGDGYDFIMANYTLNFYHDTLDFIVGKVHDALTPGGLFMVLSDGLTHERTKPAASVLAWLATTLQGSDMAFERGTVARAMLRAGFASTESRMLDDIEMEAHGPVDMIVGRKAPYPIA